MNNLCVTYDLKPNMVVNNRNSYVNLMRFFLMQMVISANQVPIWEKYVLSVDETAKYFRIGQKRLRSLINENPSAEYLISIGNRVYFKRTLFEKFINEVSVV